MPFDVSIFRLCKSVRPSLCVRRFRLPGHPLVWDNGHLAGHYLFTCLPSHKRTLKYRKHILPAAASAVGSCGSVPPGKSSLFGQVSLPLHIIPPHPLYPCSLSLPSFQTHMSVPAACTLSECGQQPIRQQQLWQHSPHTHVGPDTLH